MQATHDKTDYPTITKRGTPPELPKLKRGVLLLHGFTSHTDCVSGLLPYLEKAGLDVEMPWLRGHGTTPDDLIGVTHDMWYDDAFSALQKLAQRVDQVIVVGLSMGGVVALDLCTRDHELRSKIIACVTWAAALDFVNPMTGLVKPLSVVFKWWKGQESFRDKTCKQACRNYTKFPTKAFVSLYDYAKEMRPRVRQLTMPFCTIQSKQDQVIPYHMSEYLFQNVDSVYCELVTLEHSGHELGQDCEAKTVFEQTMRFIETL